MKNLSNIKKVLLLTFIIACFLFLAINCYLAAGHLGFDKTLKNFVNSGAEYINHADRDKVYKEFSDVNGKFVEKEGKYYLFVYNFQGKCLAHGGNPTEYVGKNLLSFKDKFGIKVIRLLIDVAKNGGGFAGYYWPDPKTGQEYFKIAYVKALDDNTLIGSSRPIE